MGQFDKQTKALREAMVSYRTAWDSLISKIQWRLESSNHKTYPRGDFPKRPNKGRVGTFR